MRSISSLFIILFATMQVAGAHSLDGDHNLAEQLGHQLVGTHHLPVTVILILAALSASWHSYRLLCERKNR